MLRLHTWARATNRGSTVSHSSITNISILHWLHRDTKKQTDTCTYKQERAPLISRQKSRHEAFIHRMRWSYGNRSLHVAQANGKTSGSKTSPSENSPSEGTSDPVYISVHGMLSLSPAWSQKYKRANGHAHVQIRMHTVASIIIRCIR